MCTPEKVEMPACECAMNSVVEKRGQLFSGCVPCSGLSSGSSCPVVPTGFRLILCRHLNSAHCLHFCTAQPRAELLLKTVSSLEYCDWTKDLSKFNTSTICLLNRRQESSVLTIRSIWFNLQTVPKHYSLWSSHLLIGTLVVQSLASAVQGLLSPCAICEYWT